MDKKCFVIMPFGTDDPELKKRFDGVYKGIIVPAVKEAGYEPVREDISNTPGSIPKSIMIKLATYDMVLADLSNANPNVFYELGIRHVMSKSATVLMMNKNSRIPFDNASYRVIQYTTDLDDLYDIQASIISAIKAREDAPNTSDNSVHDTYPELPISLLEYVNQQGCDKSKLKVEALQKENQKLKKQLEKAGPGYESTSDVNIQQVMFEARRGIKYSGNEVMISLRNYALSGNIDGFIDYLQEAMEMGYMGADDYSQVNDLCRQLDIIPVQRALLEIAHAKFPESGDIIILLARLYAELSDKKRNEKGVELINRLLCVKSVDSNYVLTSANDLSDRKLSALFAVYNDLGLYDQVVSICKSYETFKLPASPVILRNLANAYKNLDMYSEAKQYYEELMELDYFSDINHRAYSGYYIKVKDYGRAYLEDELTLALDSADVENYFNIAIDILNYGYVRTSGENIGQVSFEEQMKTVMPFFLNALVVDNSINTKNRIIDILLRKNQKQYASAINNGAAIDDEFNTYSLNYILQMDVKKSRVKMAG